MVLKAFNGTDSPEIPSSSLGYSPAENSPTSAVLDQYFRKDKYNFPSGVTSDIPSGGSSLAFSDILKDMQAGKFGSLDLWGKLISGFSGAFDVYNNKKYFKEQKKTNKFRAAGYNRERGDNIKVFNTDSKAQEAARNTALGTEGTAVAATVLDDTPIKYG